MTGLPVEQTGILQAACPRERDMFWPRDVKSDLLTAAGALCLQHRPSCSLGPGWDTEPEGGDVCLGQAGPYR